MAEAVSDKRTPDSKLFTIALITTLLAIFVHGYLSYRHVQVEYGDATTSSICNVNATFNCDVVSASEYSTLFGIPLSIFGLLTNLMLLLFAIGYKYSHKDGDFFLGRLSAYLSGWVLLASLVMAAISATQLSVYCLFCIIAYVLSLFSFIGIYMSVPDLGIEQFADDVKTVLTGKKMGTLAMIAIIPAGSWIFNGMLKSQFRPDASRMEQFIRVQVAEWQLAKEQDFSGLKALAIGAEKSKAKMVIQEFADFRCGHCRSAAPKLHNFTKGRSDVRLEFFAYPLDGACNPAMNRPVEISCLLAKTVYCGGSSSWAIHDYIFARQAQFGSMSGTESVLKKMNEELSLNADEIKKCVESEETHNQIVQQAEAGTKGGVQGTPTIFVNGRRLVGGQEPALLKAVYKTLK